MKLNAAIFTVITFLMSSVAFGNTLGLEDNGDGTWNVSYSSDGDIGGFQLDVDGATISSASGGAAGAAGFMVSSSSSTVLGFSLTGATIPAGEGVLVVLGLSNAPAGLTNIVVSDAFGSDMGFTYDAGGGGGGDITDGCDLPNNNLYLTEEGSVFYNTGDVIGGFQFNVDGATVNSATGGDAGAAGFILNAGGSVVLGFSITGATFGPGCGTMVELDVNGTASGLTGIVVSDPSGNPLAFEYYSGGGGDVEGCMDMAACNYDADATLPGDCTYPEENYDCDGNCTAEMDCAGVCGGDAEVDECGECDGDGADQMCWDGSYVCDLSECSDPPGGSVDVMYNSPEDIGGFQFDVTGVTVTNASGGAAEAAGFMISFSESTVLGFSLTGTPIPAGSGVLVNVEVEGSAGSFCLTDVILSDLAGNSLDTSVENCSTINVGGGDVEGCMDMAACNYDPEATLPGDCTYPEENYDCDGNCTAEVDCAGECGGSAVVDECGVCDGPGAEYMCEDGSYVCDASECETGGGWDGDACTMSANSLHITAGGDILYNTDTPIAGFQMDVDGATILSAGGGEAEAAGFMISASGSTVLGFSLTGATIDGCGTMVELELDGTPTGLLNFIISDSDGNALDFTYFNGEGGGEDPYCGDGECNGDEDADSCPEDCETGGGWDGDACTMSANSLHITAGGDILYNTDTPIAGFQMDVDGATILSAGGGEAEAAGFMISASGSTVLGFSLTGATIDGCGTMVELELDGTPTGLLNFIISDSDGNALDFTYFNGEGGGEDPYCGDGVCNGDEDFGSCPEDCEEPGTCDTDVCLSFSNFDAGAQTVDLHMINTADVAGFQIEIEGSTIASAAGGSAEAAGFMISASESIVLGFSVTGDVIAPSSGNLITLTFAEYNDYACFVEANTTFSDSGAGSMSLTLGDCLGSEPVYGCTDSSACNYDDSATHDDGSCWEANDGCECSDGMGAEVDECGVCNGDGIPPEECDCDGNVLDCAGVCGGDAELDACGVCDGDGTSCDPVSLSFSNVGSSSLDVVMDNPFPVAGFQMELPGINITSISGGTSEDHGFSISFQGSTLVGFSLTGDYIPAGNATLFNVGFDAESTEVCFQNVIVSDADGEGADLDLGDCASLEEGGGDCEEEWDGTACGMPGNSIHLSSGGSVLYNTNEAIAGFQLTVDGATIVNASGGASEDAGFMISFSGSTVLGFSLDGSTIDGCDSAIELELDGAANGFSEMILSNSAGEPIDISYFEGSGNEGPCCGDGECNGNEDADSCPEDCEEEECGETWDGEACSMPGNSLNLSEGGSVLYNTNEPVAGFQLTVDGATIVNASGGASEEAGFMISFSGSTVLGFSLDGSTFDGCGSAIELELEGAANGFSEFIFSNAAGEPIDMAYYDADTSGEPCCGDGICNGDEDSDSCPEDCAEESYCGDGVCDEDEDADSCPEDCDEGDCEEAWDGMACSMPGNSLNLSDGGSVLYNTNEAIAGFQLTVDGATILNASGGTSEEAGFMISFSGSTVLGFSLDGSTIDGCGSAIELELDGAANGFSDFIMSNAAGEPIDFSYFDGDANADPCCGDGICNGDEDSESCPEDCDDDCPEGYDECGVCGGDNSTCADCNGVPNGDAELDECGVCDGPGQEYECWDGEIVCNASECSAEPGSDPFSFNQSTSQAFYFVMTAYGNDGDYLEQGADWIGVYNGDLCVGAYPYAGGPTAVPAMGDDGYAYSEGYLQPGDEPTFRVYDASEDKYYDGLPSENYGFANNGMFTISRLDAVFFQTLELNEAANLVSFYVLPNDASLDMLDPILDSISGVSTEAMAAMYMEGFGWVGTLHEFELNRGYWFQMTAAATLNVEGDNMDSGIVYNLHAGANLISYSSDESSEISGAIPDGVEGSFISILGEGSAAMNTEDGWIGSLTHFDGGSGYWVIVSEDLSFSYDLDAGMGRIAEVYLETMPKNGAYNVVQSSEQAFYFVENVELLDGNIENGDWLLSYNKGALTGIRQWQGIMIDIPAMGMTEDINTDNYFVSGETPEFKLLKQSTGELISLDGNIEPWTSNGVFVVNGLYEREAAPETVSVESAYPNPFNPSTNISFGLPADSEVSIQVYNLQGRVIATLAEGYMNAGYHSVTWNADNFSSGVYFVKVIAGSFSNTQKLLLVKQFDIPEDSGSMKCHASAFSG